MGARRGAARECCRVGLGWVCPVVPIAPVSRAEAGLAAEFWPCRRVEGAEAAFRSGSRYRTG